MVKKIYILLKLSLKFFKKYFIEYFKLMLKPIFVALIIPVALCIPFVIQDYAAAIISLLIALPCIFYSFWKGFLITYSLNIAAYHFLKPGLNKSLRECYKIASEAENDFAKYICFYAIITIIGFLPTILYFFHALPLSELQFLYNDPIEYANKLKPVIYAGALNSIVLLPFLNFATQAYLLKKENENYVKLFFNCYTKLNATGFIIALIANAVCFLLGYIYILIFMPINVFVYSINTFWYSSRTAK